jgi:hypothetical protein
MADLSFSKRISLCKKKVFDGVTSSGELEKIAGSRDSGYYSLETIYSYLHPACIENDIDLDVVICEKNVNCIWTDCLDDSKPPKLIAVDFSELVNLGKLPLMQNMYQSWGAGASYKRRYALTAVLGLPATDKIDGATPQNPKDPNPPQKPVMSEQESKDLSKLQNILYLAAGKDNKQMVLILEEMTAFKSINGLCKVKRQTARSDFKKSN